MILVLGGPRFATLEVEIYRQTIHYLNLPLAAALSIVQVIFTFALMAVYTSVQRSEGTLTLCHVSDRIQSLFMITKLLTIFDTHPSEKEAVESFK